MGNPTDGALARLRADWPRWEFWIVHRLIGGPTWCARRRDDHRHILNADTAEHLAEYIEDDIAGRQVVAYDAGAWISGPCEDVTPRTSLPALVRLIRHADRWLILRHLTPLAHWSAERVTGTAVRYLAADSLDELAAKIEAAEVE